MDKVLDWAFILGIAVDFLQQFVQESLPAPLARAFLSVKWEW